MTLFSHADHADLMKRRQSLIKERRRARDWCTKKKDKIEAELRAATTEALRIENAGRAA